MAMIQLILSEERGDKCDLATLAGIVQRALLASTEFRSHAEFRSHDELLIITPTWDNVMCDRVHVSNMRIPSTTGVTGPPA